MKKLLAIEAYNSDGVCLQKIICGHMDACKTMTLLSEAVIIGKSIQSEKPKELLLTEKLIRKNIQDGLITLYYESGHYLEIQRIYA